MLYEKLSSYKDVSFVVRNVWSGISNFKFHPQEQLVSFKTEMFNKETWTAWFIVTGFFNMAAQYIIWVRKDGNEKDCRQGSSVK